MKEKTEQYTAPAINDIIDERNKYKDLYIRTLADYQNLQRRSLEEKRDIARRASDEMFSKIIHLYQAAKAGLKYNEKGAALIYKAFIKFFNDNNIGIIDSEFFAKNTNNKFSEDYAVAVSVKRPDDDCLFPELKNAELDNTIYAVIDDGFYNIATKKVISYANVIVYKVD